MTERELLQKLMQVFAKQQEVMKILAHDIPFEELEEEPEMEPFDEEKHHHPSVEYQSMMGEGEDAVPVSVHPTHPDLVEDYGIPPYGGEFEDAPLEYEGTRKHFEPKEQKMFPHPLEDEGLVKDSPVKHHKQTPCWRCEEKPLSTKLDDTEYVGLCRECAKEVFDLTRG